VLAVYGFLSTEEVVQDVQLVLDGLAAARAYPRPFRAAMAARIARIQAASLASLDASAVNPRLV
jgi:hypothetical protein